MSETRARRLRRTLNLLTVVVLAVTLIVPSYALTLALLAVVVAFGGRLYILGRCTPTVVNVTLNILDDEGAAKW